MENKRQKSLTFKVYGRDGHRQAVSFQESTVWDFSNNEEGTRIIKLHCSDSTGTNDYVLVEIIRDTYDDIFMEMEGQLSDGIFENYRYGEVEVVNLYA